MSERDRGDRPKKTWREMDAQRDRAGPRPPRDERAPGSNRDGMDARASKQYRAALDALFAKGEVGKLAEKLTPGGPRVDPIDLVRGTNGRERETPRLPLATPTPASSSSASGTSVNGAASGDEAAAAPSVRRAAAEEPPPKKDDSRALLRKKVLDAVGRDEISRAVDKYVKQLGWPRDFEVLEQALEHNKEASQTEAMGVLEQMLQREKPKRSRTLAGKLRYIEETSASSDLREQAARIRTRL